MTTNFTLFDRLVSETQKLSPAPIGSISKDPLKRWTDLAAHWKAHPEVFPDCFYETIFHIGRCRYSRATAAVKPLLCLIEEAILNDMDALSTWKKDKAFTEAFYAVSNTFDGVPYSRQRWKSTALRDYVWDKLYEEIIYRDRPLPAFTVKTVLSRKTYLSLRNQLLNHSGCTRFEELIQLLVPGCHKWTRSQWRNEKFIFAQIEAIHGVDFSKHIHDFDKLVVMFRNKAEHLPYYKNLFSIKTLSTSIATAIWPNDTEKEIIKQFNIACTVRPRLYQGQFRRLDPVNPLNMANSWAFQQLSEWRSNRKLVRNNTRSNLMEVAVGNHPWVVKARQKGIV